MAVQQIGKRVSRAALLFVAGGLLSLWTCSKNAPLDPNERSSASFVLLVGLQSQPEAISPGGSAIISALVVDENNRPVAGELVRFSSDFGALQPTSATTNDSGLATSIFTAPQQSGTATISGARGDNRQSVRVQVQETAPKSITLIPEDQTLLANGATTTPIRSVWRTESGQPLTGIPVRFTASAGSITSAGVTDSSGVAFAELTSVASTTDLVSEITATANGLQATTQVVLKGINFELATMSSSLTADGRSEATIKAVIKEATTSVAVQRASVVFGADLGTIPNAMSTNSRGVAETTLISSTRTGLSTVTASYGLMARSVQVAFTQSLPTYLAVSVQPPEILADNKSTSRITAVVSDQANNPVPDGTGVSFNIIEGTGTIESNKATAGGQASSLLTSSTQPDTVRIAVRVAQLADTTTVRYIIGVAAMMTVVADSSTLPADGKTSTTVTAQVFDASGNPVVDGTKVDFSASIGDITPSSQTVGGVATAQFSSSQTGTAEITASVGALRQSLTIQLRPGAANSILLTINPNNLGVKDSGRNQTVTITADVIDSKNNAVADGTLVRFSIFQSPGGGEFLSSTTPLPTLNGKAQVSLNSGIRSGSVRVMAEVTDAQGSPIAPAVRAVTTEITIFAGPPYIEDVNDRSTSHLSVGVEQTNILGWGFVNTTTTVTAVVGDKFNNPVPAGTAVFFTTTGGVISTYTGVTDQEGVAMVTLHTAQPLPDVTRYYATFVDPNSNNPAFALGTAIIPGPIPDFENSQVVNSLGGLGENDGIGRILAVTEGVDSNGNPARAWAVTNSVFSGLINVFTVTASDTALSPGESATIDFEIYDENGNPIVPGSEITVSSTAGNLSWTSLTTADPGATRYQVLLTNNLDPSDPNAKETATPVTVHVNSQNGNLVQSSGTIQLKLN